MVPSAQKVRLDAGDDKRANWRVAFYESTDFPSFGPSVAYWSIRLPTYLPTASIMREIDGASRGNFEVRQTQIRVSIRNDIASEGRSAPFRRSTAEKKLTGSTSLERRVSV